MRVIITGIALLVTFIANGQLKYFKTIVNSTDTFSDLHYYKVLESPLKEKLDSFLVFMKQKKGSKQSKGFIEVGLFKDNSGKIIVDCSFDSEYSSYRIFSTKKNNYGHVFGFCFYKKKLILFTAPYSRHRVKSEYESIIHELIYEEISNDVKQQIDTQTEDFLIGINSFIKRYYIHQ